jgi:hypothetical protein
MGFWQDESPSQHAKNGINTKLSETLGPLKTPLLEGIGEGA